MAPSSVTGSCTTGMKRGRPMPHKNPASTPHGQLLSEGWACETGQKVRTGQPAPAWELPLLSGQAAQSQDQGPTTWPPALHWRPFELRQSLHEHGPPTPSAKRGRDLGLEQCSAWALLTLGVGSFFAWGCPGHPQPLSIRCLEPPPTCDDQMLPGEQNLLVENKGPGAVQGPSLAPPVGAESEASNLGMANSTDPAWPPRVHHAIPRKE